MTADAQKASAAKKKIPSGSIKLQMAGDLILARCPDRDLAPLFRRYEALLENFANTPRDQRLIGYKMILALILTSHAKKAENVADKKALFDQKNQIFIHLANHPVLRRLVVFRYLTSKNFRVLEFCPKCTAENTASEAPRFKWKFCQDCKVDRKFYNVMAMDYKFKEGQATIFLSNDMLHLLSPLKSVGKGKLEDNTEEAIYRGYHYNVRNLDVFALDTVMKAVTHLMTPKA